MSYFLRRLSLPRLALLCLALPAAGGTAAAAASAVDTGPVPPHKSLPTALHDALASPPVDGVTARIQYTNHLLEGASLASGGSNGGSAGGGDGGGLASSPLLTGASGRLWISKGGQARLELQSDQGATEVLYDHHTLTIYDASQNTVYRFARPANGGDPAPGSHEGGASGSSGGGENGSSGNAGGGSDGSGAHGAPSQGQVEAALGRLERHANVSEASPTDVASQPAYTVTVSPRERGSLIAAAALSFDAVHGVPLRAALYSTEGSSPVIELQATEVSYGPIESSIFTLAPPEGAKVLEPLREHREKQGQAGEGDTGGARDDSSGPNGTGGASATGPAARPHVSAIGQGIASVLALRTPAGQGEGGGRGGESGSSSAIPGARTVQIDGAKAQELQTALGTLLTFERDGARYLLAGLVPASTVEAAARGL